MRKRQSTSSELSLNDFLNACGAIKRLPKPQKVEKIQWSIENVRNFDSKVIKLNYGILISMLKRAAPVKPMVDFLILITDESMVTQSRVTTLCDLYVRRNYSPSIQRLLRAMSKICPPHVYIPPLAQKSAENACIPTRVVLKFASRNHEGLDNVFEQSPETRIGNIKTCTEIYYRLCIAMSDVDLAKQFTILLPLIEQCGRVPLPVERRVYEYLEEIWVSKYRGEFTQVLYILLTRLLRYWPTDRPATIQDRLLRPSRFAQEQAADVISRHIWHSGPLAEPSVEYLSRKYRPTNGIGWKSVKNDRMQLHIYLYYAMNSAMTVPSASVVRDLILHKNVYLFPCSRWASTVPEVCRTLQGEFDLVSQDTKAFMILELSLGERVPHQLHTIFNLNNSPWVGGYPQRSFSRVKALSNVERSTVNMTALKRPVVAIDSLDADRVRRDADISYPDFYRMSVFDFERADLHILPFLQSHERSENTEHIW